MQDLEAVESTIYDCDTESSLRGVRILVDLGMQHSVVNWEKKARILDPYAMSIFNILGRSSPNLARNRGPALSGVR